MAQKARKDLAKSNSAALKNLHITSLAANSLFVLLSSLFLKRSFVLYGILSIPAFAAQFILERSGRPKYVASPNGAPTLKNAGEDLGAQGLTEYMFDVVWVTWACLLLVLILGNWGWVAYGVVPVFALWKGWALLGMARGAMGGGLGSQQAMEQPAQGNRKSRRVAA